MFIAHGPIAYLVNEKFQKNDIKKLDTSSKILISLLAIFFGILPDFDMFLLVMKHLPTFLHHSIFTHSLTFWILIWLVLKASFYLVSRRWDSSRESNIKRVLLSVIEKSLLIGTVSHLFIDAISSEVRLLYPLETMFTVFGNTIDTNLFTGYLYSPYMALEILILTIFFFHILNILFKKNTLINIGMYLLMFFSSIYLLLTGYIALNTYNSSTQKIGGKEIVDADFDMILDTQDPDTNNNFVNNIDDVDHALLAKDALRVISSNAIVAPREQFVDKIYLKLGAFNSYRLISQIYTEQNKPIEPVLKEYVRAKNGVQGYTLDLKYSENLLSYLKDKDELIALDTLQSESIPEGRVIFVTESNGDVVNLGITLENSYVGIVFDNDKRLQTHSISEVQNMYKEQELYIQL